MFPVAVDEFCVELELVKLVEPGVEICHLKLKLGHDVAVETREGLHSLIVASILVVQAQEAQLDVY
jgi:hypothetical protein